jgi:hypothetical protein
MGYSRFLVVARAASTSAARAGGTAAVGARAVGRHDVCRVFEGGREFIFGFGSSCCLGFGAREKSAE